MLRAILGLTLASSTALAANRDDKPSSADRLESNDPDWTVREYGHHERPHDFTLGASLLPNTLALDIWYAVPVLPDGFIGSVNDSLDVEFGALVAMFRAAYFGNGATLTQYAVVPSGGVRWNFHLTRDWTPFASAKVGAVFGLKGYNPDWFSFGVSLGTFFRIRDDMLLRLELGFPSGLAVGLTFLIGK